MATKDLMRTVKRAVEEDGKRPAGDAIRDLIDAGVIDEQGVVFSQNLAIIEDLLRAKGFNGRRGISAFHIGGVPSGAVRLHEKVADGRNAEGPYDKMAALIKKARSEEALWKSLAAAGYCLAARAASKKKTG